MCDRRYNDRRDAKFPFHRQHDNAGSVFGAAVAATVRFRTPQVGVTDHQARLGVRESHASILVVELLGEFRWCRGSERFRQFLRQFPRINGLALIQ